MKKTIILILICIFLYVYFNDRKIKDEPIGNTAVTGVILKTFEKEEKQIEVELPEDKHIKKINNFIKENYYTNSYLNLMNKEVLSIKINDNGFEVFIDDEENANIKVWLDDEIHFEYHFDCEYAFTYEKDGVAKDAKIVFSNERNSDNLYYPRSVDFVLYVNDTKMHLSYTGYGIFKEDQKIDFTDSLNYKLGNYLHVVRKGYFAEYLLKFAREYFKIKPSVKNDLNEYERVIPQFNINTLPLNNLTYYDDYLFFEEAGLWGISDYYGKLYIPPFTQTPSSFVDEENDDFTLMVSDNNFINKSQTPIREYWLDTGEHGIITNILGTYNNEVYIDQGEDDYSHIDKFNPYETVINFMAGGYEVDKIYCEGTYCATKGGGYNQKIAVFDNYGNRLSEYIYDDVLNAPGNLVAVRQGTKWGYVNWAGELVIPIEYKSVVDIYYYGEIPYPEYNGYVVLKNADEKFGVMDIYGNVVKDFIYDWALPYRNGYLLRENNMWTYYE